MRAGAVVNVDQVLKDETHRTTADRCLLLTSSWAPLVGGLYEALEIEELAES